MIENEEPKYVHTRKESYSSLSLYENCPYQYKRKYIEKNYTDCSTLALEMGTLVHGVMEEKMEPNNKKTREYLDNILQNGYVGGTARDSFLGLKDLQKKYYDTYGDPARKSGLTYKQKLLNLEERLLDEDENGVNNPLNEWNMFETEMEFEIEFHNVKIGGFIDKIEINQNGDFKISDYKTSDSIFDDSKIKTALQMYIYAEAIKDKYGKYPIEFEYDFILLGQKQQAMSKGWEKRGQKKLTKIIDNMMEDYRTGIFIPKPAPLCYWCDYNEIGITKDPKVCRLCEYYSLWTPTQRSSSTNKDWGEPKQKKEVVW